MRNRLNLDFLENSKNQSSFKYNYYCITESPKKMIDKEYKKLIDYKILSLDKEKPEKHSLVENSKIHVLIRKRPLFQKEINNGEIDCISCINPKITVHECKIKVDGITKYIEDNNFYFDNIYSETETTEDIYYTSLYPIIDLLFNKCIITCFAYGQTGSGKTYTMKGIQNLAIKNIFKKMPNYKNKLNIYISFYEIYGDKLFDLLNNKNILQVLDDKNGKTNIFGLKEIPVNSEDELFSAINKGNSIRATHNTITNETSSRSHAICNIILKNKTNKLYGKLILVDLAGSERAQETRSNNKQRMIEGKDINKSLLALKECIRALYRIKNNSRNSNYIHVPFRASKLTHVLRDSFINENNNCKIIMISCINPSYISSNHTLNTLRYSDRLKEKTLEIRKINHKNKDININDNSFYKSLQLNNQKKGLDSLHTKSDNYNTNINLDNEKLKKKKSESKDYKIELFNLENDIIKETDNLINDINFEFEAEDFLLLDDELNDRKFYYNNDKGEKCNSFNNKSSTDNSTGNSNSCKMKKNNSDNEYYISKIKDKNVHNFSHKNLNIKSHNNIYTKNISNIINSKKELINKENDYLKFYINKSESKKRKKITNKYLLNYNLLINKIIKEENDIVETHVDILRKNADLLLEEGELISKIKEYKNNNNFNMNNYLNRLDEILDEKINNYNNLKNKIDINKNDICEEKKLKIKNCI